jgi:ATP-dependent Zn protease
MGLFKRIFQKMVEADAKERSKNEPTVEEFVKQINEKRIEEARENGDERTAKYYESRMDKEYVRGERSIGEQNVELYALVRDQTVSVEDVEAFCEKLMLETYAFKPL